MVRPAAPRVASTSSSAPGGTLILGTTTSTQDSGLLDMLVPSYESGSRCRVKTVAVGSGEALAMGAEGDADVLLVHSPAAEETYMAQGHGLQPGGGDAQRLRPARAQETTRRTRRGHERRGGASAAIAAAHAPFASRADASGTNAKELALLGPGRRQAERRLVRQDRTGHGRDPDRSPARSRPTPSRDRGTYLATKNLDLRIVSQGGAELFNAYHVIVVGHAGTNVGCAREFAGWSTSSRHAAGDRALRRAAVRAAAVLPGRPARGRRR